MGVESDPLRRREALLRFLRNPGRASLQSKFAPTTIPLSHDSVSNHSVFPSSGSIVDRG